jgi:C1A family cysteine protease
VILTTPTPPPWSPTVIDCTPLLRAVRDQGQRGTCVAFATTAVHEHARAARRGVVSDDLSPEHLFWRAKQIDGNTDDGTTFISARDALADPGQCNDSHWPYVSPRDLTAGYAPPPAVPAAPLRRATMTRIGPDLGAIADVLGGSCPVVAGLRLWEGFYDCDSASLSPPNADIDPTALHAVCLTGLDEQASTVMVRNSWGTSWGDGGYAWVALSALDSVLLDSWVVEDDLDDGPS